MVKLFFIVTAPSLYCVKSCGVICCIFWHAIRIFLILCVCILALVCLLSCSHACDGAQLLGTRGRESQISVGRFYDFKEIF